ncbi:MAG TPA: hypothetical protein VFE72_03740 [Lysobacter sp.]|nr:hypothetical protein [Lysobacter sp.]
MKSTVLTACLLLMAAPVAFASQSDDAAPAPVPAATDNTAAPATAPAEGATSGKKKVCTRERPMGSNMTRKVCRIVDEREADAARDAMGDLMRSGPSRASDGGL